MLIFHIRNAAYDDATCSVCKINCLLLFDTITKKGTKYPCLKIRP